MAARAASRINELKGPLSLRNGVRIKSRSHILTGPFCMHNEMSLDQFKTCVHKM